MSTNGDLEMADANAGADVNDAEVELVEPQRIRVVSLLYMLFLISLLFRIPSLPMAKTRCGNLQTCFHEQI